MKSLRLLLSILFVVVLSVPLQAGADDRRLDIYWVDVEGGAATVIVTPAGESIVIDCGLPRQRFPTRIHDLITNVCQLQRVDHLIITHYDTDHFGGAVPLAKMLPVRTLYDNGRFDKMVRNPGDEYWNLPCAGRVVIDPGDQIPLQQVGGDPATAIAMTCYATRQEFVDPPADAKPNPEICRDNPVMPPDQSENKNSTVFVLDFGSFRFFDAGDLTWNFEQRLVCPVNLIGSVDVYQVTHHGLDQSNHPAVIRSLRPTVSVMNNGRTKGCQPRTFATLKNQPTIEAMYQVHKNQRSDGDRNNTANENIANIIDGGSGNYIKLSVAADGESYTVAVPRSDHSRTFATTPK